MKKLPLAVLFASAVVAGLTRKTSDQLVLGHSSETEYQYLIELGPGDTKWIVEEEKWALKRVRLVECADRSGESRDLLESGLGRDSRKC